MTGNHTELYKKNVIESKVLNHVVREVSEALAVAGQPT